MRTAARFTLTHGAWRLTVRVLDNHRELAALWRQRGGHAVSRGERLHGLFFHSDDRPLGTVALSAADLTHEIVAHEATHAAMHALRLLRGAPQMADDDAAEEYLARTTGQLTRRILRGLAARGVEVRA